MTSKGISPIAYGKRFKIVQTLIVAIPVASGLLQHKPVTLGPPLGVLYDLVSPTAFVCVGIFGVLPWLVSKPAIASKLALFAALSCMAAILAYAYFVATSVVQIHITTPSSEIRVSIGDERTEFARNVFKDATSEEMVRTFGHQEEDLQRLWTRESIRSARMRLLASYVASWALMNLFIGCAVIARQDSFS